MLIDVVLLSHLRHKLGLVISEPEQNLLRSSFVTMSLGDKEEDEGVMIRIRRRKGRIQFVLLVMQEIPIACFGCERILCV